MIPVVLNPGGKRRRSFRRRGGSKRSRAARRAYMHRLLCGGKGSRTRMRKAKAHYCAVPKVKVKGPASHSFYGMFLGKNRGRNPRRARFHYRGRRGHNPSVFERAKGGVKAAFSPSKLAGLLPVVGGILANNMARNWIGAQLPASIQGGLGPGTYGNIIGVGLATSGILGYLSKLVLPRYSEAILKGGIVEVAMSAINQATGLSMKGCAGCQGIGCAGCGGLFDYLTPGRSVIPMMSGLRGGSGDGGVYMARGDGYTLSPDQSSGSAPSPDELDPLGEGPDDAF
jgi:hypothetical protein